MPYLPVPSYTEISHFRAPYKDSLMGFGLSDATWKTFGPTASVASDGRVTVSTGSAGVSAKGPRPPAGVSARGPRPPAGVSAKGPRPPAGVSATVPPWTVVQKPPISSLELDRKSQYFLNNLYYLVNIAAYGKDPKLWQYKPKIEFREQWLIASAMMVDKKSQWRKDFRLSVLSMMRSYEESSVLKVGNKTFNRILNASYGWTLPKLIAGTALDPVAAVAGVTKKSKTIPKLWATREEALNASKNWSNSGLPPSLTNSVLPPSSSNSGLLSHEEPVRVSAIPVPTQVAIEDSLVADCHAMKAFLAKFVSGIKRLSFKKAKAPVRRTVNPLTGRIDARAAEQAKADARAAEQVKADARAAEQAKKDADAAIKKADNSLAKAKQENESLKQMLEDLKASLQQKPPAPLAPPENDVPPSLPPIEPPPDPGTSRLEVFGFEMTATKLLAIGAIAAGGYYFYSRKKA